MMGLFDGGMFDIDGDWKTTEDEEVAAILALAMVKKMEDDKQLESAQHQPRRTTRIPTPKTKEVSPAPVAPNTEEAVKQPVSADEYRRTRKAMIELTLGGLALALTLCVLSGLFIWAAISTRTPGYSGSNFVSILFVVVGMEIIIFIFYIYIGVIKGQLESFLKIREQYRNSLNDQKVTE